MKWGFQRDFSGLRDTPAPAPAMASVDRVEYLWNITLFTVSNTVWGFPGGASGKNLPANARDAGSIPGSGRSPGGGRENVSPVACSWASLHLSYLRASHLGLTPDLRMPPALAACCLEVCLLSQNHGLEVRWPGFQSQLLRFLCDFRPVAS